MVSLSRRTLLAGTVVTGVLSACRAREGAAPSAGQTAGQPQGRTQPIELRFMSWRPNAMDRFEKKWAEWGEKHKVNITIERNNNSGEQLTKITAMFASDTGPDIWDTVSNNDMKFYDAGFVLQLDSYISRDKLNLEKDWALTGIEKWRNKWYALPYWVEPFAIYYNKTIFEKKGIQDPWERSTNRGDWTLEEMVEIARRCTDPAENQWGLHWSYTGYHDIGPFIWTRGASHFDLDQMKWQLDIPESVAAHQDMLDWLTKLKINLPNEVRTEMMAPWGGRALDAGGMTPFALGKVAIHYRSVNDWSRMWPVVRDSFQWDMMPVPRIGGRPGAAWTAGHPVAGYSKTKYPEDVWAFMKWMIMDEFQSFMAEERILVPAKKDHQPRFFRPPDMYPYQHAQVFADVFKRPYGIYIRHYGATEDSAIYSREVQKIYRGEISVVAGLKQMTELMNQVVNWGGGDPPFKGMKMPVQPTS